MYAAGKLVAVAMFACMALTISACSASDIPSWGLRYADLSTSEQLGDHDGLKFYIAEGKSAELCFFILDTVEDEASGVTNESGAVTCGEPPLGFSYKGNDYQYSRSLMKNGELIATDTYMLPYDTLDSIPSDNAFEVPMPSWLG